MKPAATSSPATPATPVWRKALYGLLFATLLLGLALLVLEAGLRVFGYGHASTFHREVVTADGRHWWRENPHVTTPYFSPELRRRPQAFRLPVEKPARSYRLFVLGSSAAMGDPEPAFSLSRTLEVLLRAAYPNIHFEVVNAGITAVNSHVVREVAADCAAMQPDAFIVYEGNNEVIGPFGPGTVFTPFLRSSGAIRAATILRRSRTGQLAAAAARGFGRDAGAEWGGMQMFLQHEITADDPRLVTTRELFRENLAAIAESGRDAGALVLLCTVATNVRDFAPFLSRHRANLASSELADWQGMVEAGRRALAAGNTTAAVQHYTAALQLDDEYADLHFQLGRVLLGLQRTAEAKEHLQRARDLDALRFRTDSGLNAVIRSFASPADPLVRVVDLLPPLEAVGPDGLIGDNLLYEHVHLNFQGTYLAARRLFAEVSADLKRRELIPSLYDGELPDPAQVRWKLGYTIWEQVQITRELRARCQRAPFTNQSGNEARLAALAQRELAAQQILARSDAASTLERVYDQALEQAPDDWLLRRNAGLAFGGLGLNEKALSTLQRAATEIPDDPDTLFAIATVQRRLGRNAAADATLAELRAIEPRFPGLETSAKK